jgi:hypothetical protein
MASAQVFDLIAQPELIRPPYSFYSVFVVAGLALAALAWLSWRFKWRTRNYLTWFAPVWIALVAFLTVNDAISVAGVRNKVKAGAYTTIEGCLDYFHPGDATPSRGSSGDERWQVEGSRFSYGTGNERPGYHVVEPAGGIVHADSRLSVSFVHNDYYDQPEIVRIKAIPHACPKAPDGA